MRLLVMIIFDNLVKQNWNNVNSLWGLVKNTQNPENRDRVLECKTLGTQCYSIRLIAERLQVQCSQLTGPMQTTLINF